MISLVTNTNDFKRITSCLKENVILCKIKSMVKAYGFDYELLQIWVCYYQDVCKNSDNSITGLIMKFDGHFNVYSCTDLDWEECIEFFKVIGGSSVTVINIKLNLKIQSSGVVVKNTTKNRCASSYVGINRYPSFKLQEAYNVISDVFSSVNQFDSWYVDVSHRIRHHSSDCIILRLKNQAIGCGMITSITEKAQILSSICVLKEHRKKGYGKKLVLSLLSNDKTSYAFIIPEETLAFYKSIGFKECGEWTTYILN